MGMARYYAAHLELHAGSVTYTALCLLPSCYPVENRKSGGFRSHQDERGGGHSRLDYTEIDTLEFRRGVSLFRPLVVDPMHVVVSAVAVLPLLLLLPRSLPCTALS